MRFRVWTVTMLLLATILTGRAEETNSAAVVENLFAAPLPSTNAAVKLLPALNVKAWRIKGNPSLSLLGTNLLSPYTGQVNMPRLREALEKLQARYHDSGYTNVIITLPPQKMTNGILDVSLAGNGIKPPAPADLDTAITNLFTVPKSSIQIRGYRMEGNTVLPPEEFSFLTNYTGELDIAQILEGVGKLQLRYRDLGFPTIGVVVPPQKLTNGIVRVKIVEGRLSQIVVKGNHYYSSQNIINALPSLRTNILLNTKWFQPELDRANLNLDRQIYPVIAPGFDPGTTELTLKVKDQLPFHGHMEIDDKSPPNTPLLRLDAAVQYDNLWQLNHQLGFDYNFSPQAMKADHYDFYDQPMVASYSGYYRMPLGAVQGLRDDYENMPVTFGYDEITHRFNLPPATGNPELIVYASRSVSDTPVRYGPQAALFTNLTEDVFAYSAERDLTFDDNFGLKLTVPLQEFSQIQSSFLAGLDYKSYEADIYSTNLTTFNLYGLNPSNPSERGSLITNSTVALAGNSHNSLYYLPISLGWIASRPDPSGSFSFNYNQSIFLTPLASSRAQFQTVAGSSDAGGNYTTINAGLIRLQNLPAGWSAVLNGNGQWSSAPLISNEQFAIGGTGGVRGYREGEDYGDTGWRVLFDLRAPALNVGFFPSANGGIPAYLRCSWFMDCGETYLMHRAVTPTIEQWGTGMGFLLTASEHFTARLTLGWALHDTPVTQAGDAQAYFSVGYQF